MRVTLLGTGSPIPHPLRAGPSTLVQAEGSALLVDCGRGVLMRLAAAAVAPTQLAAVLLTHLHSDHITDLNDVITTHWVFSNGPTPLVVVGPVGTQEVVDGTMAALAPDLRYRLAHHDDLTWTPIIQVHEVGPGETMQLGPFTVHTGSTDHRPVEPTVGYRVEHGDVSVALAGDSIPCDGLDDLCRNATAYVQTVIRDDIVRMIPNARLQDILDYHSSVEQAGQTAARAGVGTLILTHYVPGLNPGQEDEWRAIAAKAFSGPIVLGDDLTAVDL
jgi:ribonuclease Z